MGSTLNMARSSAGFIAKEKGRGQWMEITERKQHGKGRILVRLTQQGFLLKASQSDKASRVQAEECDLIWRGNRYQGRGCFIKLTQEESC